MKDNSKMTVKIDKDKCIGCGICASLAEDYFEIDLDTGKAKVIKQPGGKNEEIISVAESCPVEAIIIED